MRGWGARQLAIGMVLLTALILQEKGAFTTALVAVLARVVGDVLQNILDGCYWKLAVFVPVEGVFCFLIYYALYM